jgi:hypothetical protein
MVVLWMSELTWEIVNQIPIVGALRALGATVTTLEPLPITGQQTQAWQMSSGQNPGRTGYFDIWTPQQYRAQHVTDPTVRVLHEVIAAAGCKVSQVDLTLTEVPGYLSESETPVDCLIVRTVAGEDIAAIAQALQAARTWAGTDGAYLLLSDYHAAAVKRYVNLNDGLRVLGVLEVSEQGTIRWEETLAYHVGHGQLWINLEGREPFGIVAPREEYDRVCHALITSLPAKLLDPQTGEPMIEQVYRRDELYRGDYLFRAPDLVVVLRPGYAPSPSSVVLGLDGATSWPAPDDTHATAGLHPATVAGLVIAVGVSFATGQTIAQAPLGGIAPTLLHTLRLPIPTSMDAAVITDLFAPAFMQQFPVQRAEQDSGLSAEDEEEIMARLQNLGYVG